MISVLEKRKFRDMYTETGHHAGTKAEIRVMLPHARECQRLPGNHQKIRREIE